MPESAVTLTTVPVGPETGRHPMASRSGIAVLAHLLDADAVWRNATKPQRRLIAELCGPVMARLIEHRQLAADELPALPDGTRTQTVAALEKRGLACEGRLTGRAIHAFYWTVWRSRPVVDVQLPAAEAVST